MEKNRLTRQERAKQFAPFDALKGLHEAIRLKEYQHERIEKGEVSQELANHISSLLINLKKQDEFEVTFFEDGHIKKQKGKIKLLMESCELEVNFKKINLDNLLNLVKTN